MGMYGDKDVIVHPKQWQPMLKGIPHAHIERFPQDGHFLMLEEPQLFAEKLKAFLDQDVSAQQSPQAQSSPLNATTSVTLAP